MTTKDFKNSFAALGLPNDEAVVEALRADLADVIRGYIGRAGYNQTALGRRLGIPQSTVSAIKNDNIDRISLELMLKVVTRAGIPWAAACTNAPHDARLVAGGISQLVAASRFEAQPTQLIGDYWKGIYSGNTAMDVASVSTAGTSSQNANEINRMEQLDG